MYKHITQINNLCCGAVCMQMVYNYFNLKLSQESIWNEISRPNAIWGFDCDPYKMQQHFHSHGLATLTHLAIGLFDLEICKIDTFFPWIQKQQRVSVIVNYTLAKDHYHFVLLEKAIDEGIIVQDPSSPDANTFIPYQQLQHPQAILVAEPTQKNRCPHCKTVFPSCELFFNLYQQHISRCAYCKKELFCTETL